MLQQVPCRALAGKSPEQDFLIHFKEEIPALGLLGTSQHIDPGCDYSVDKDVQLVCKYLKAYDSGAINTLYNEFQGKWTVCFIANTTLIQNTILYMCSD